MNDQYTAPERVDLEIPQPKACETYYSTCAAIDQHNRHRQDTLQLERKLKCHSWHIRVGISILGIIITDTWQVYKRATRTTETQKIFHSYLAEELIDNRQDTNLRILRSPSQNSTNLSTLFGSPTVRSGLGIHLTPTKRKRKCNGQEMRQLFQGRGCIEGCGKKTTFQCSACVDFG